MGSRAARAHARQGQGADLARGVLSGILTGVVVSAVGLGIASLATGPVRTPLSDVPPSAEAVEAAELSAAGDDAAPDTPVRDASDLPTSAPGMPPPASAEAGGATPDPAPMPEADAEAPDAPDTPQATGTSPNDVAGDMPAPDTSVPATQPSPPPAPEAPVQTEAPPAPVAADSAAAEGAALDDPAAAEAPSPAPEGQAPDADAPDMAAVGAQDAAPDTATAPPMVVVPAEPPKPAPRILSLPTPDPEPEPALPTGDSAANVVTGRLPSIGAAPPEIAALTGRAPALERNAIEFAAPTDQPMMAFLLIDMGGERAALGDLDKLPFPITVAVDAAAPDAAAAIAFYRALGAETVLGVPLPEGATATDVAVTFEAYAPLLEQTVAVMIDKASGFQTLGEGAVQVAADLAATGHGLVSFPQGLNTGHKSAVKDGVAAGLVFRDLDGEGQAPVVIRRFLDNAAFRARDEKGVIVLARARPDTLQALLEWSLGNRAQTVTLAPLSAVLMAQ